MTRRCPTPWELLPAVERAEWRPVRIGRLRLGREALLGLRLKWLCAGHWRLDLGLGPVGVFLQFTTRHQFARQAFQLGIWRHLDFAAPEADDPGQEVPF